MRLARASLALGALGALGALAVSVASCAQLLGYDGLEPRDEPTDAAVEPDVPRPPPDTAPDPRPVADADADAGPPVTSARAPARPPGSPVASGTGKTLWVIVDHFYLGTQAPDGTPSRDAWKDIGFDLDHVCTGEAESIANVGTCLRDPLAKKTVLADGNLCRDNNWGSQLLPLVSIVNSVFEKDSNDAILAGTNSWLLVLRDLDPGADDPYVPGALYKAAQWADLGRSKPKFDGSDVRQVEAVSVFDHDVNKPRTVFPKGYVVGNTWVSGEPIDIEVSVPIATVKAEFNMIAAVVTLELASDHSTGGVGTLAGGLPKSAFEGLLRPVAAAAGFCPGSPLYDTLQTRVQQYVDLVAGAPNLQNTTVPCDTMSVGIGMTVAPLQPVTAVVDELPQRTPCDDAGVDAGSDAASDVGTDAAVDTGPDVKDGG
ncbi:MAG: hypothetical protein NVS3B10_30110 [Polyangiales bacterium]